MLRVSTVLSSKFSEAHIRLLRLPFLVSLVDFVKTYHHPFRIRTFRNLIMTDGSCANNLTWKIIQQASLGGYAVGGFCV